LIADCIRLGRIHDAHAPISMHEHQRKLWANVKCRPTKRVWVNVAKEVASETGVCAEAILQGNRNRKVVVARWEAWRRVLDSNPRYSVLGLARIAGFDHTAVLHGIKKLNAMRAAIGPNGGVQ